jgi:hypothetical protein
LIFTVCLLVDERASAEAMRSPFRVDAFADRVLGLKRLVLLAFSKPIHRGGDHGYKAPGKSARSPFHPVIRCRNRRKAPRFVVLRYASE